MASDENSKETKTACTEQIIEGCAVLEGNKNECEIVSKENFKVPDTGGGEDPETCSDMELGSECSLQGACGSADGTPVGSFEEAKELVDFKLIFNKKKHDICFPLDENILALKKHFESLIGVPASMQKVMYKGLCKDDKTLREVSITKGAKVMVVGSTLSDIIAVNTPSEQDLKEEKAAAATKEPLCKQKMHKKILDKGVPEDIQPGIKNAKDSLPPFPLSGMVNKSGGKVRLTFKLELDQVWIGTKERTDKIPMNSIKTIVSEPIEGHEEYHIMGIQLGTTEASRYWLYWVPAHQIFGLCKRLLEPNDKLRFPGKVILRQDRFDKPDSSTNKYISQIFIEHTQSLNRLRSCSTTNPYYQ
ncbi:ubiquitin domain-containing protein UBFD1 [Trichonephila clavipes]|uniref:Ubiquitin domain-containing protein UBFD1 n=1 Tax=Trichonephila clavipes TaxID=2585209 RepID=A0A8X6SBA3_TRICX|nr:ubiquitin domain-containing protein UBFD1 [Trichonephila clavipes]